MSTTNNSSNLSTISSSKYDIYSKLLDLCANGEYITSKSEFENTDFLRSGLFGYVTESLALMMRDSSFHKTMIYRENFLNTAIMPKSIYNFAKMFNIDAISATPSVRYAEISISTDVIEQAIQNTTAIIASYKQKYGIAEASNFMVLDKINPIIAGEYYFSLEHSIEIYKNKSNKYIVKYCLNETDKTTEYGTYSNGGIINTSYVTTDGTKYLVFKVLVAQYKRVESSKIITGSSFVDIKSHTFSYNGQLCGMTLTYEKGGTTENINLKFSNIELEDDKNSTSKVAYYSLSDEGTIEITFVSNKTSGLPQVGGTLNLTTFITDGFSGNISYNGDAVFLIKQDDFKSLPISVALGQDIITSGVDTLSLGDLKNKIIDNLSMRDTIITENDLNTWFSSQSRLLEDVSNSSITFRKEKDNLLKRTFAVYLLLRDGAQLSDYINADSQNSGVSSSYISNVVPTNTIDVIITTDSDNNDNIIIEPTSDICYDIDSETYSISSAISTKTDYNYRTPFTIKINKKYNQASYFYLETNDSSELELSSVENMDNISIVPTQVTVERENTNSANSTSDKDKYNFTFNVSSDANLTQIAISSASIIINNMRVQLVADNLSFEKADDNNTETDESSLTNYKLEIKANYDSDSIINNKNTQIELNFDGGSLLIPEEAKVALDLEFGDRSFSGILQSVDELTYFMSLDDIISSDILINKDNSGNITGYTLKDVPVVASYWMNSNINKKWFIRQLFVYINMLKENINKLEMSTFFNIKFRNTYGIAHYYSSVNTQLRLNLTIYIDTDKMNAAAVNLTSLDSKKQSIENEIRDYIRVCVDNANENGELVVSKIIMQTQAAYYNFIKHIDFNGLNGTFNQYITSTNTSDVNYPIEYFSLDYTTEENSTRLNNDIVFIYE